MGNFCSKYAYEIDQLVGPVMVLFCWVLRHMNYYWLFNAKSSLYIYIKYIGFG